MDIDSIISDIFEQFETNYTAFGEPQAFIEMDKGRSIEVVKEVEGLSESDYYYSVRLHCSEDEYDNDDFHSTMGVIESYCTDNIDENELRELITSRINANKLI